MRLPTFIDLAGVGEGPAPPRHAGRPGAADGGGGSPSAFLRGDGPGRAPARPRGAAAAEPPEMHEPGRGPGQVRRHARFQPRTRSVVVTTEQGVAVTADILDLSQSGVALEGSVPGVWVGSMVTVGSRRAKAVRMLAKGMALEFSVPIPAESLNPDILL